VAKNKTYEVVELYSGDALIHAGNYFLRDGGRIYVFRIKAIAKP